MGLVLMTTAGAFIYDRIITFFFARDIFDAMLSEARKTTVADVMPIVNTIVKIGGGLLVFISGNPIIWFGAFTFGARLARTTRRRRMPHLWASKFKC